jgi:hypothetical protein
MEGFQNESREQNDYCQPVKTRYLFLKKLVIGKLFIERFDFQHQNNKDCKMNVNARTKILHQQAFARYKQVKY